MNAPRDITATAERIGTEPREATLDHPAPALQSDAVGRDSLAPQQPQATSLLAAITQAASNPNIDMQKMRQLFDMHKEMVAIEAEAAFNAAMARAQQRMVPVVANRSNTQTNSMYADLGAIAEKITPHYTVEGISISFDSERPLLGADGKLLEPPPKGWFRTIAMVSHSAGHTRLHHVDLPSDDVGLRGNANKTPIQGVVSSKTYGRRVLKCLVFDIAISDTDGNRQKHQGQGGNRREPQGDDRHPPKDAEKPAYPNDSINANLDGWKELVRGKKKTAERIISQLKMRYKLTEQQESRIKTALDKVAPQKEGTK